MLILTSSLILVYWHILISKKVSIGKKYSKYFISYVNHFDDDIKSVLINLPKLSGFTKSFEKLKLMSFMLEGNQRDILKKYINIWNRVKSFIEKDFDA